TRQVATLEEKAVDALEWSAAPVVGCSHITNEEEQADFASLLRRSNYGYEGRIVAYGYDG
ncbi:MAG: hypothetical protein GTO40_04340, partial [Deltaproteobacteria bacterium]|nr:hypothetical protein [Deltaproteobacteria bacterium]